MDDFWQLDYTIIPIDNWLRSPGLKFKCAACGWESKVYREGDVLYAIMQDLFNTHSVDHD